ncbi:MAG: carbohydrate ABC transporter permease [Oscillospiraceae bacterium]|nr:carbohydrate ABC transporter permease [Oscillospiraceae bacterium]
MEAKAKIDQSKFRQRLPDYIFILCNTIFMCFIILIMLYPFVNTLAISLNDALDSVKGGIGLLPRKFTLDNFDQVFKNARILTAFTNSVGRTVISTAGGVFLCSMAAYVLSRKEFMWNKFVTVFFLLTMYISAGLIPMYMLYGKLSLINSFNVYWIPGLFGAFNIIVIRTYIQGLPDSLVEAARLDGAGEFRIFAQIVLPICKPVLATVGLWIAVGNWNDWFTTAVYVSGQRNIEQYTTLQYELYSELQSVLARMGERQSEFLASQGAAARQNTTTVSVRAATTIVAALPILCVYPFLQKYFVKGVHVGSVKG